MTYAESTHLGSAIKLCSARCRKSAEPYLELSSFVSALRGGGVSETYIQAINHAVLRDIASVMMGKGAQSYCHIIR
jgi:hypothetical protein